VIASATVRALDGAPATGDPKFLRLAPWRWLLAGCGVVLAADG
jgi:hypothetical protein